MKRQTRFALISCAALALWGCGDEDSSMGGGSGGPGSAGPGAVGVTPGGSQDFGLFRKILEQGLIPGPETLEDVGFFAEHKLDYPTPDCGQDLCMHGLLGAMGNMINGANCTLIQLGMNSPIDPETFDRPPMHLVIAVDTSGSMQGQPIQYLRAGLVEMIDQLEPSDTVSLVKYSGEAIVLLDNVSATETTELQVAFESLAAAGSTNLYDGLFTAYQLAATHFDPTHQNRVVFLSDGVATAGLDNPAKLRSLAEGYAKEGIALTTIGVGTEFDIEVMRGLGEVGAGNFYFLEDPAAVLEVFSDEVQTFLWPLALDARIAVSVASAYELRAAYGASRWTSYGPGGFVDIPSLYLAGRTSSEEPIEGGRRGGGGAILLELVAKTHPSTEEAFEVGSVSIEWRHPLTGDLLSQNVDIAAPFGPDSVPEEGYFDHDTVEKGFVMLNIYAAFKLATELAADSDPRTAQRTLGALRPNVADWLLNHPDPDIEDDLHYVDLFMANLDAVIATTQPYEPAEPPNPWPAD
jgi:Ca-activated chloride channel family protein